MRMTLTQHNTLNSNNNIKTKQKMHSKCRQKQNDECKFTVSDQSTVRWQTGEVRL